MLLDDKYRPITNTVGLFNRSAVECANEYVKWMQPIGAPLGSQLKVIPLPAGRLGDHLKRLTPLVKVGDTRTLFVAVASDWTACFANGWRGTDMSSTVPMLSTRLPCRALRVTCTPDIRRGGQRRYGARIVELHDGAVKPVRAVNVANDGGRWVQYLYGSPLPQEDPAWFGTGPVARRFTTEHLQEFVRRIVPGFWEVDCWPRVGAYIVERGGTLPRTFVEISLEEVQKDVPMG